MNQYILIAIFILFPALVLYLCYKYPIINNISPVAICYITGITMGNIGIFPPNFMQVQESVSEVAVVVALPLLLFSIDIKKWVRLAGKTITSMLLATLSIIIIASLSYFFFKESITDAWQLSAMSTALYTGGTPNLAAIKTALQVDSARFVIMHTYDTVFSMVFIIFCITFAQRFFNLFLPVFQKRTNITPGSENLETEDIKAYGNMFAKGKILPLLGALLLSAGIVGLSALLSTPFSKEMATSIVILSLTTLGILASLIPKVHNTENTFQFGMYIIYIFCFVVGSMVNYEMIININYIIMAFVIISIFGSMIIHAALCRVFKVDTDTFLITSTSAICSPPFVPVVAGALKNKEVVLSGLLTGIVGYAIGNYLGISLGFLLKSL